jgi:hypothetical protein
MNEMVEKFNNQVKEMDLDLDLSGLSEFEVTSSDVAPAKAMPLSTVEEHEARITFDDGHPLDTAMPTFSSEKVSHKKSSLTFHFGHHIESVKKGVKNRVVSLLNIALNRFSSVHAMIRLPPSSSESMSSVLP